MKKKPPVEGQHSAETTTEELKQNAVRDARDPKTRTALLVLGVILLITLIVSGLAIARTFQDQDKDISTLSEAANDLSKQVEEDGKEPVVDVDKLPTAALPTSDTLNEGDVRRLVTEVLLDFNRTGAFNGRDGISPPAPKDGKKGDKGDSVTGDTGATGAQGIPGTNGTNGVDGKDGAQGDKGDKGDPPESWSFTFTAIEYTCTDPDEDGHYDCVPAA